MAESDDSDSDLDAITAGIRKLKVHEPRRGAYEPKIPVFCRAFYFFFARLWLCTDRHGDSPTARQRNRPRDNPPPTGRRYSIDRQR